jgi:hypothetical protein
MVRNRLNVFKRKAKEFKHFALSERIGRNAGSLLEEVVEIGWMFVPQAISYVINAPVGM